MCKSANDPACPCSCIDGCSEQCIKDWRDWYSKTHKNPSDSGDVHPSGPIPKEDCLSAANGLISDLEAKNADLKQELDNLRKENQAFIAKRAKWKKILGFSLGNVFNLPMFIALGAISIAICVGYFSNSYVTAMFTFLFSGVLASICSLASLLNEPVKFLKALNGWLLSILSITMFVGSTVGPTMQDIETRAITLKVEEVTRRMMPPSPQEIIKNLESEKEKLSDENKKLAGEIEELKKQIAPPVPVEEKGEAIPPKKKRVEY